MLHYLTSVTEYISGDVSTFVGKCSCGWRTTAVETRIAVDTQHDDHRVVTSNEQQSIRV